jgi:hypothetical protein
MRDPGNDNARDGATSWSLHSVAADRILVAGNSAFGIDAAGRGFIAAHTGRFLTGLRRRGLRPRLAQPGIPLPDAPHIFDYPLDGSGIDTCALDRTKRVRAFLTVLRLSREADFAHLFFPGRMARWTAIACALAGTRYSPMWTA